MKGIFVGTDNTIEIKEYSQPLFKSLENDLRGSMERVNPKGLPDKFMFFCNERGLSLGLPINGIATYLYQQPIIVGNVVIFKEGYVIDGIDTVDMTDDEAKGIVEGLETFKKNEGSEFK